MTMKREPVINEQQTREIVERMGRKESRSQKSMGDFYRSLGLEPDGAGLEAPREPEITETEQPEQEGRADTPTGTVAAAQKRVSSKQRRLSLSEYRDTYLQVPKITDRKPVFVSGEVRDRLDEVVRRLGGRGMSASGFVENLARLHLEAYREDIEQWRKL